ncbi:leucine--tRNA ligase [bacterium]|nr:leucine--tRNA ligase [bacterium]
MSQKSYDHTKIEKKWQKKWLEDKTYSASDSSKKEKYYALVEFPYPSGDGLHTGHVRPYVALDIISRKRRMEGFNVLYPFGWDAFGLPTENFAIKTGVHPKEVTKKNTDNYRRQVQSIGVSFDWDREINTTDPSYYKWTQWIFLQLFKKDLAYKAKMPINWCLSCKIGLANEEVIEGRCERCGGETEKRDKEQWMLKITAHAERLLNNLDNLDYLEPIKIQQRNWIGKSEGAELSFKIKDTDKEIKVFTTRPDTLYGATYVVLAPEHPLIGELHTTLENFDEVSTYIKEASKKTEQDRTDETKEKTGVELKGLKAVNPVNREEIPIWVADYVLYEYGTGAIMAVPGHDERDYEFAKKFNLPIVSVIEPPQPIPDPVPGAPAFGHLDNKIKVECWTGEGNLTNSGEFNGISNGEAKEKITKKAGGELKTTYKLRDWVFSRQRYWGEPIPIIYCNKCGMVPVPENELPLELPDVEKYEPTDDGESPLANIEEWVNVECPECKGPAKRETDVMPNWAGSSWYFLRYIDPKNDTELASKELLKQWMPVDWYNGGMEHTTLHLLYSRFWNQFLYDIGAVPTEEPYKKRTAHGLILAEGGVKMSKSKGNVVNPDDVVTQYGADTLRVYEMFMGPFDQAIAWSTQDILGARKFLERAWGVVVAEDKETDEYKATLHKTIKKVSDDIENMDFNTAVSQMMICVNTFKKTGATKEDKKLFVQVLAPFAPHMAEELWEIVGGEGSVHTSAWPVADEKHLQEESYALAVQVNGKVRETLTVKTDTKEEDVKEEALALPVIKKWTDGKEIKKVIYVEGKIINIVV